MIKNHLLERFTPDSTQEGCIKPSQKPYDAPAAIPMASISTSSPPVPAVLASPTIPSKVVEAKKEAELYDFIFNENASCAQSSSETPYMPDAATIMSAKAPMKQSLNSDQMLVSEYDNESALNGGMLFGGLKGFDMQERTFMAYEPVGCDV